MICTELKECMEKTQHVFPKEKKTGKKGKQVDHALKQLKATLYQAELAPLWESSARVFGRIVCKASVPRIQRTDAYLAMEEEFRKRGGSLKMQEVVFEEEYRNV